MMSSCYQLLHKSCVCLREACESALKEKHFLEVSEIEGFVEDATNSQLEQLEALGRVFTKAAEDDIPTEVHTVLVSYYMLFVVSWSPESCYIIYHVDLLVEYFRYQTIYAVESHLTFFVILSFLQAD